MRAPHGGDSDGGRWELCLRVKVGQKARQAGWLGTPAAIDGGALENLLN
jgi:hypothetical protein